MGAVPLFSKDVWRLKYDPGASLIRIHREQQSSWQEAGAIHGCWFYRCVSERPRYTPSSKNLKNGARKLKKLLTFDGR